MAWLATGSRDDGRPRPTRTVGSTTTRVLVFAAMLGSVVLLTAGPVAAHVSVTPSRAEAGAFTQITFGVPNERAEATTNKVEVVFPVDHPLAFASVRPVPGWQVQVQKTKLTAPLDSGDGPVTEAVSKITWSGGSIADGQYQNFDVSVGPLPTKATSMVFKALQTYSDGALVRWIDLPSAGGEEPEHPAPVLEVNSATVNTGGAAGPGAAAAGDSAPPASRSTDWVARVLAGLALLVAFGAAFAARSAALSKERDVPASRKPRTRA
jgi:uncharacterized protein YcnI